MLSVAGARQRQKSGAIIASSDAIWGLYFIDRQQIGYLINHSPDFRSIRKRYRMTYAPQTQARNTGFVLRRPAVDTTFQGHSELFLCLGHHNPGDLSSIVLPISESMPTR